MSSLTERWPVRRLLSYVLSHNRWEVARPHMEARVSRTLPPGAAETPAEVLTGEYRPLLPAAAAAISADWAACQAAPHIVVGPHPGPQTSGGPSGRPSPTQCQPPARQRCWCGKA